MADQPVIQVQGLTVRFGEQVALDDVSFHIVPGEFVLLTGPSGCGKSTLARALNGLIPHSSSAASNTFSMAGKVIVDGLSTAQHGVPELATHVGLVFQRPAAQLFCLTVAEEVACGPQNLGLDAGEVSRRAEWAIQVVGIQHLRTRRVSELSGGEQQRVAIAAVLAMRPKVLVLDEPTSQLDFTGADLVLSALERLRREHGLTILLIEHRLAEVAPLAGRVIIMDAGRIAADGAPDVIFGQRDLLSRLGIRYPWHLLDGRVAAPGSPASPTSSAGSPTGSPGLPILGGAANWSVLLPRGVSQRSGGATPLVSMQGVEAGYGREMVLHGLDLALYPGEFVALVGENGAGKSTVGKLLAGLARPRRGRVVWHSPSEVDESVRSNDCEASLWDFSRSARSKTTEVVTTRPTRPSIFKTVVTTKSPISKAMTWLKAFSRSRRDRTRAPRVGLVLQDPLVQLFCDNVEEEVAFGPRNFGVFSAQALDEVLAAADLNALRQRSIQALSCGQQQRTALAAILALKPELLIVDEPTLGQDWGHLSRLMDFLVELNSQGMTILVITHDYKVVCRYVQRVLVLREGRIVADGAPCLPAFLETGARHPAALAVGGLAEEDYGRYSEVPGTFFAGN